MTSMNISLPEPLKLFVDEQVSKGGYSTVSDYLLELIREAQRRTDRQELEAKLLAGLQSPTGEMSADEWTNLREGILAPSPELRDQERTASSEATLPSVTWTNNPSTFGSETLVQRYDSFARPKPPSGSLR
jgi:antitoxin ParD1/3/4